MRIGYVIVQVVRGGFPESPTLHVPTGVIGAEGSGAGGRAVLAMLNSDFSVGLKRCKGGEEDPEPVRLCSRQARIQDDSGFG